MPTFTTVPGLSAAIETEAAEYADTIDKLIAEIVPFIPLKHADRIDLIFELRRRLDVVGKDENDPLPGKAEA